MAEIYGDFETELLFRLGLLAHGELVECGSPAGALLQIQFKLWYYRSRERNRKDIKEEYIKL